MAFPMGFVHENATNIGNEARRGVTVTWRTEGFQSRRPKGISLLGSTSDFCNRRRSFTCVGFELEVHPRPNLKSLK
jgi:hypothetical protein